MSNSNSLKYFLNDLDKNNIERIITGSEGKYIEEDSNKDLESSILKKIKID